jgi:hypothetical protein
MSWYKLFISFLFIVIIGLFSCKKVKLDPENIFVKIYEDPNSDLSYYPIDIIQLPDNGYFILGESALDTTHTWTNPVIIKTDNEGELEWKANIDLPYVNPVSNLMELGGNYYFFCMDELSLGTHVLTIDGQNQSVKLVTSFINVTYPLAVSKTPDNGFLLLSYNRFTRQSVISKINTAFNIVWQCNYNVLEDAEPFLIDHLIKTGKKLSFFTGTIGENSASAYYANGMYNYTLSMLFVNPTGVSTGVAQGFRYSGGAVSVLPIQGNNFAVSRQSFDEQFILPSVNIDVNNISSISEMGGSKLAEISPTPETRIKKISIEGKPFMIFAANTNNNQVVLYFYDTSNFELKGKKYLGFSNPIKIASIIQTSDMGIAVLAQTMVAGRFKRMCLYKIPKEHIKF